MTYICGNPGPLDNFNPFLVTRQKWVSELLYTLNERPLNISQISSELKIKRTETSKLLDDLTRIQAVKEESGFYSVAFAIFTRNDLFVLKKATRPIARELSDRITDRRKEIDSLVRELSSFERVESGKLLFAALGCFVLDWLGLKILQKERVLVKSKPQPGDRDYLLFARERLDLGEAERIYGKMYWGSNNDELGNWVFTSFGDHTGFRYAFPDVVWTLRAASRTRENTHEKPSWMTEKVSNLTDLASRRLLKDVGRLLFELNAKGSVSVADLQKRDEERETLEVAHLLEDMNYVTRARTDVFKLNYPVFTTRDKKVIERLGILISPLVVKTIRQNSARLRRALENTNPIRNNIEFNEILNEAWHWIFAQTNKTLAEKGFLHDPPKDRIEEARYMAWVSEFRFS